MNDEKLIVLLYAFRYAVHRIPTQALSEIQDELLANLPKMPDWMLAQMERDLEWNFELMDMYKDKNRKGQRENEVSCNLEEYRFPRYGLANLR